MSQDDPAVTDAELLVAFRDFFDDDTRPAFRDAKPNDPGVDGWSDRLTLAGLKRVIERDRARRGAVEAPK